MLLAEFCEIRERPAVVQRCGAVRCRAGKRRSDLRVDFFRLCPIGCSGAAGDGPARRFSRDGNRRRLVSCERSSLRSDGAGRRGDFQPQGPSPRLAVLGRLDGAQQHAGRQKHPHQMGCRKENQHQVDGQARFADLWQPGGRQWQGLRRHEQRRRLRQTVSPLGRLGVSPLFRRKDRKVSLAALQSQAPAGSRERLAPAGCVQHSLLRRRPAVVRHQSGRGRLPRRERFLRREERRSLYGRAQ
jgi:hypothetical protein